MRTTITIDDGLLDDLRRRAGERGATVSHLIEDSVRLALGTDREETDDDAPFELVTDGAGGRFSEVDVGDQT